MMRQNLTDGYGDKEIWREIEAMKQTIKDLDSRDSSQNESLLTQLNDLNAFINLNVPPVVNYIDNGDFVFEQEDYVAGTNYAGDNDDCANWYWRPNNSSSQYTEHTTTVQSGDSLTNALFADDAWWNKTSGELVMGTRAAVAQPMPKNLAFPGGTLFCRFQVKLTDNTKVIQDGWRLRAAIWDNTSGQQKIIEGAVFDLSVVAAVASPGSFTRKYILKVDTNMDFFYSDVLTPSQVTNQVSVTNIDNVNFVTISWSVFPEAVAYKLYRHDSEFNEWREIAVIRNGATSFRDVGGRTGALFIPPGANILPRAQALFVNFAEYVTTEYQDAIFNIFVPSNYNYALTTNKQWIRLDMVDENLNDVIMPDDALLIDKIALGYTNGRFCYSGRDLVANAAVTATTPPPTPIPGGDDGGGGDTPPSRGGGGGPIRCVIPETLILVATIVEEEKTALYDDRYGFAWRSAEWKEAKDVKVGDYLVNISGGSSKVTRLIKGTSTRLHTLTTERNKQITCSPSHKLMQFEGSDNGTPACQLVLGDKLWVMNKVTRGAEKIVAIEILETPELSDVITFVLEGNHTYISNEIVSHNLKPLLPQD